MEQTSSQYVVLGVCPVCSTSQENLYQHLGNHSKDEIITALTPQNQASENVPHSHYSESSEVLQVEGNQKNPGDITPQEYASSSPVESGATVLGTTIFSTPSVLPYQTSMSTPTPIFAGIKNNPVGVNSNILPGSFPTVRATYIQNGSSSGISQFVPSSIPVVYRHPSTTFQIPSVGSNSVLLQSPQVNLNAYNGFASQNVTGSYAVGPPSVDQAVSSLPEVTLPTPGSQIIANPTSSHLESVTSPAKAISEESVVSNIHAGSLPSCNVSGNSQGHQTFLCILPLSRVQPSVPAGSNYILYGNSVLPATNMMPEVLQQALVNNPQFPNTVFYMPSNLPQFGLRQENPASQDIPLNRRPVVTENRVQTSLTKISSSSTSQTVIKIDKSSNCVIEEKISPAVSPKTVENKTTIEVGDNIKITLPKDMVGKKERLKELINRELVRALLINDSEGDASPSGSNIEIKKSHAPLETKRCSHIIKDPPSELNNLQEINKSTLCNHEIDCNTVSPLTVSFTSKKPRFIGSSNNLQSDCRLASTSKIAFKNSEVKNAVPIFPKEKSSGSGKQHFDNLGVPSHSQTQSLDSIPPRTKAYLKTITSHNKQLPSSSELVASGKFKIEGQETDEVDSDSSLAFLSLEKNFNFLGDTVFSDSSYPEDQVLGAVEEVFAGENGVSDCKSELPSERLSASFSFNNSSVRLEHQFSNRLSDESTFMSSPDDDSYELSSKIPPMKYAKTYCSVKKPNHFVIGGGKDLGSQASDTSSQIDAKLCGISVSADDEIVDDPAEEMETHSNATNETFSKDLLREESFNDDSKEARTSLYHGVPLKIENGESNGAHTEEIMSLKASETLADSDSERATPSDEMTEIYYGKSCIFAGEPGPPHLSSQEFPHIEESEEHLAADQIDDESVLNATSARGSSPVAKLGTFGSIAREESSQNPSEDTISLTLDANCSILPADTLHLPQLFSHANSNLNQKDEFLKEEAWTKPGPTTCSKLQVESKPFVTTGIVMDYSSSSPHASTSGLQSVELGTVKKGYREEEEYDFEYESDCYGDSDSDIGHLQKGHSDLERWRCQKCNKTFKSLKEKLLHSGHHSPCSLGKAATPTHDVGFISLEGVPTEEQVEKSQKLTSPLVDVSQSSREKDSLLAESSSKESKALRSVKSKRKSHLEKFKEEEKEVGLVEDWRLTRDVSTTSTGDFKCTECSLSFPSVDKLYEHRANAFKSRYTCPICHLVFRKRNWKLRHLKLHPLSELKCSICHRSFDSFYSWSQHQLFHMGLIVYECKECGHKCQRKGELEIHYRKHSGERPFKCETCLNTFVSSHSLKRHLIVHMKGQETECDVCHKRYKNAIGLGKHKLKMHPKKKKFLKKRTDFMCDTCNEVFHSEKKLSWHQETHERWPKKCQQCGECFIHQSNLTKHIRFKHDPTYIPEGSQKESVNCPVCKKAYKRSSLSLHMRTHTGVKPYKCSVCGKEFTVKCNYLAHQWIHTGVRDRPYKCKLCERSFHRQRFLEAHIRSHKKIRPYTCNECGKSFIHKSNFQTHSQLHTEEKQHECGYCGKTFFRKYNLNNHVRIHTGETPFECTICRKEFTQKSNFNVHMKAFHVERHAIHEEV